MTDKEARNPQMEDMGILAAAMAALGSAISIQSIGEQANPFMKELGRYSPVKTAATFGALLTQKRLQPNCLRLEALVHLSIAVGEGRRAPLQQLLVQGYAAVGKACGQLEDPPEDVFVGNIYSKRGNYRVLEGIWESGTFYLQRFVNLVDGLPDEGQFRAISDTVHALLRLSDLVCERAGLTRNEVGSSTGESQLPARLAAKSDQLRRFVRFDLNELGQLGIEIGHWTSPGFVDTC
jgi:hypothetical protein